jgi:small subunit ribosomal protein S17e
MEILEKYKEKFGTDFVENKKILNTISIVRSKGLKNELAGYITKLIKREIQMAQEEKIANEHAKESEQEGRSEILQPNLQIDES